MRIEREKYYIETLKADINVIKDPVCPVSHCKKVYQYDINNNSNKYDWAEPTKGKGVIYYLRDEFGNEAPYDLLAFICKAIKEEKT